MELFSIFDEVAEESMPPFTAQNEGLAMRMFDQSMLKMVKETGIDNRSDFKLYRLGTYDTIDMEFTPLSSPKRVVLHKEIENGSE